MSVHRIKKKNPLKQNRVEDPLRVTFGASSSKCGVIPPKVKMNVTRLWGDGFCGIVENGRKWSVFGV